MPTLFEFGLFSYFHKTQIYSNHENEGECKVEKRKKSIAEQQSEWME
jgi:hypothetical protein